MVGITSYGAYVPLWRLGKGTADWRAPGERSMASFDEDSITMAVAAAINCLGNTDRSTVDGLIFASTTSPYAEKQAATTVSLGADLRRDITTMDCTDTLRAGTTAMRAAIDAVKAGSARKVLLTVADMPMGGPRSSVEANSGDGAAAFLFGNTDVAVEVLDSYTIADEITDIWRPAGDATKATWEDRFCLEEGYVRNVKEAATAMMKKAKLTPKDFAKAVFYAPDARRHREMARTLGFAPEAVQDPLFGTVGSAGAAHVPMMLVAALEEAKPGDKILVVSYGNGADAYVLQVSGQIEKIRGQRGIKALVASKKILPEYGTYLQWRGLFSPDSGVRRPPLMPPSAPAVLRERDWNLRFHGVKCNNCGYIQHPPQRVCTKCHARDNFEAVRLSDKRAKVFTYAMDYVAGTIDVPMVLCVLNLEGGGRILSAMTDRDINEMKVGMPVELSFRKLYYVGGVHNYFWKCIPVRA